MAAADAMDSGWNSKATTSNQNYVGYKASTSSTAAANAMAFQNLFRFNPLGRHGLGDPNDQPKVDIDPNDVQEVQLNETSAQSVEQFVDSDGDQVNQTDDDAKVEMNDDDKQIYSGFRKTLGDDSVRGA